MPFTPPVLSFKRTYAVCQVDEEINGKLAGQVVVALRSRGNVIIGKRSCLR